MIEFQYQDPFPLGPDQTEYRLLTSEYVSRANLNGQPVLKVEPEALTFLARKAMRDVSFYLRVPKCSTYKDYIWDHAAGQLIVEEAGGTVSDVLGNEIIYEKHNKLLNNTGVIASNGLIHEDLVKVASKFVK